MYKYIHTCIHMYACLYRYAYVYPNIDITAMCSGSKWWSSTPTNKYTCVHLHTYTHISYTYVYISPWLICKLISVKGEQTMCCFFEEHLICTYTYTGGNLTHLQTVKYSKFLYLKKTLCSTLDCKRCVSVSIYEEHNIYMYTCIYVYIYV